MITKNLPGSITDQSPWSPSYHTEKEDKGLEQDQDEEDAELFTDFDPELMELLETEDRKQSTENADNHRTESVNEGVLANFARNISREINSYRGDSERRARVQNPSLDSYIDERLSWECFDLYEDRRVTAENFWDSFSGLDEYDIDDSAVEENLNAWDFSEIELVDSRKVFDTISLGEYKTFALGYKDDLRADLELENGLTDNEYETKAPVLLEVDHKENKGKAQVLDPGNDKLDLDYCKGY